MTRFLAVGGTGFIGQACVSRWVDTGHDVTVVSRGEPPERMPVGAFRHERVDRNDASELTAVTEAVDPDVVVDFAAFHPPQVRDAVEVFADVDTYVYISSTHAYQYDSWVPLRENDTPLRPCKPEQETDDSFPTYGPRKAEGDRIVFEAAEDGFNGMIVRPAAIYGPHDQTQRQNYWIDRVERFDEVVVPGDQNRMPTHLGYIEDVVDAIQLVIEKGTTGEAYNIADRRQLTFDQLLGHIAGALDTSVTAVHVTEKELDDVGLTPVQISYGEPYPYVVSTEKIRALGLESTPYEEGITAAVEDHLAGDRYGRDRGPDRELEEELIAMSNGARTDIDGPLD